MLFCINTISHAQWCNQPDSSFCPGNYFQNGDFEIVTSNPNALWHQDINVATGWNPMWGGGSLADLWCSNGSTVNTHPVPNSNVYAGMWIVNHSVTSSTNPTYREGMYNRLATPIAQNSGVYTFNFDIANSLHSNTNNNLPVEMGIYGVYNQSNAVATPPGGLNANPTNLNLWQSNPSVDVVLLDVITTPVPFTNNWTQQTVSFNSASLPSNGITHIMITAHDNARPSSYRGQYINFDKFCLQQTMTQADLDSLNCCPNTNLIPNGNFEAGNTGFISDYTNNSSAPNGYTVTDFTTASTFCSNWAVEDHTHCAIGVNRNILFVNGQTQQSSNANNVIWQTANPINVQRGEEYKFCASVQHLPQCCFDVTPKIKIEGKYIGSRTWFPIINSTTLALSDPNDPCDWEEFSGDFTAYRNSSLEIRISLEETGNGDGNDLAIDDISLIQKTPQNITFSIQDQPTTNPNEYEITASINSILSSDDYLADSSCQYVWFVSEVSNMGPPPSGFSNRMIGGNVGFPLGRTTTFSPYNGGSPNGIFHYNKAYIIYLGVYDCECSADDYVFQMIYNSKRSSGVTKSPIFHLKDLPETQQQILREQINNIEDTDIDVDAITPINDDRDSYKKVIKQLKVKVTPNPFVNHITIGITLPESSNVSLTLTSVEGKVLMQKSLGQLTKGEYQEQLDTQHLSLADGMYFITIKTDTEVITRRVVQIKH